MKLFLDSLPDVSDFVVYKCNGYVCGEFLTPHIKDLEKRGKIQIIRVYKFSGETKIE